MDDSDRALPPPVVIPPPKRRAASRRRRRRTLLVTLLILVLAAASYFGGRAFIAWRFAHVPDVSGLSQEAAITSLKDAGYRVAVQPGPEYSETVKRGRVVDTDPDGSSRLATGKTVTVTLSAGPHYYAIPDVSRESYSEADRTLLNAGGLTVAAQPDQRYSDTVPANQVIGTTPAAGRQVRSGQTVTIVLSKGPPFVSIPNIDQGTSYDSARHTLRKAQFKVNEVRQYDDIVPEGDVIDVSPKGTARKFSPVTVTVSKGPQMVPVPDIPRGTAVGDAESQLQAAGLQYKIKPVLPALPEDLVYSISPGSGTSVPVGSTVVISTF